MSKETEGSVQAAVLARPLEFAGGKVAHNRLAKAPMEELLAPLGGGAPTPAHLSLYRAWARGGWGLVITGNVAVESTHLGTPFDVTIPSSSASHDEWTAFRTAFRRYADAATGRDQSLPAASRPLAVVQLVHAGRQSMRGSGRSPFAPALAPSSVPMRPTANLGPLGLLLDRLLWGTPHAMSVDQIHWLRDRFVLAAKTCYQAGFDGVELHASHGYQLAAFLSPLTNTRTDAYGGSAGNRARFMMEIIDAVRSEVPDDFLLGVKLNSSDYVHGGLTEDDALQNVQWLAEHGGVDFVEISGGNYENPSFVMEGFDSEAEKAKLEGRAPPASARTAAREAFFASFSRKCRSVLPSFTSDGKPVRLKLILTGGLRSRAGIASALASSPDQSSVGGQGEDGGSVDMACLGRPAALFPDLPRRFLDPNVPDGEARADAPKYRVPAIGVLGKLPIKIVGAGWGTLWHSLMMVQIALGAQRADPSASLWRLFSDISRAPTSFDVDAVQAGSTLRRLVSLSALVVAILAIMKSVWNLVPYHLVGRV